MKSKYNKANHSFQEQPEPKPDATKILGPSPCGADYECLDELVDEWEARCKQLRTIPCRPEDQWDEGTLYEEGKHYEVYHYSDENRINRCEIVPKEAAPPAQEAELWRKLFKKLNAVGVTDFSDADINLISNLYELKSYTLSLKSEQPEATGFAVWATENLKPMFDKNGKLKFWIKNSGIHEKDITTEEAYKEYQLFKQKK